MYYLPSVFLILYFSALYGPSLQADTPDSPHTVSSQETTEYQPDDSTTTKDLQSIESSFQNGLSFKRKSSQSVTVRPDPVAMASKRSDDVNEHHTHTPAILPSHKHTQQKIQEKQSNSNPKSISKAPVFQNDPRANIKQLPQKNIATPTTPRSEQKPATRAQVQQPSAGQKTVTQTNPNGEQRPASRAQVQQPSGGQKTVKQASPSSEQRPASRAQGQQASAGQKIVTPTTPRSEPRPSSGTQVQQPFSNRPPKLRPYSSFDSKTDAISSTQEARKEIGASDTQGSQTPADETTIAPKTSCLASKPIRIGIRHIEGNGIGYNQGYTTLEGFFPFIPSGQTHWVPFLDLRGHIFNNGKPAANAGLGLRYVNTRIWGINTYYDYRKTKRQHYNQVSLGLESLGRLWDFRLNGYLPVGRKTSSKYGTEFGHFEDHYLFLSRKYEFAMKGANAEVGFHIDQIKQAPFYIAAGPYYLTGQGKTAWGGQLRVACDLFQYVHIEGNTSYDSQFNWIGQGQLGVNIPLGPRRKLDTSRRSCPWAQTIRKRATQEVDRFEIIPTDTKRSDTIARNPANNEPYFFWFVDNTSHSDGTFESPFSTLADAQNSSDVRDIIYVYPGDGTTTGMDSGFTMKQGQKLWGSSLDYTLATQLGSVTIPAQSIGRPHITGSVGTVIEMGSNCEVAGLYISTDDSIHGIRLNGISNSTAQNNLITGTGIIIENCEGTITVQNNIIETAPTDAIALFYTSGTSATSAEINILNNTINGAVDGGIFAGILNPMDSLTVNIENNTIQNTGWGGITLEVQKSVSHLVRNCSYNVLTNTDTEAFSGGAIALQYDQTASGNTDETLIVSHNTISTSGSSGISISNGLSSPVTQSARITYNSISDVVDSGITVNNVDSIPITQTANVSNNTISDFGAAGIILTNDGTATSTTPLCFTIKNNTISATSDTEGGIVLEPQLDLNAKILDNRISVVQPGVTVDASNATNSCVVINDNQSTTSLLLDQNDTSTIQVGSWSGNNQSATLSGDISRITLNASDSCDCE
jgi:trimeric autotransporter adhesin